MLLYFLFPYPIAESPSQRFRFEQYFETLKKHNIPYKSQSFFDEATWVILYKEGHILQKVRGVCKGYLRRIFVLFKLISCTHVFIHRELAPWGPPVFEWIIAKILRKKIVYDFDDALWLTDLNANEHLKIWLKNPGKTANIIKWSWRVSAGNQYLCDYARRYNKDVILNPTTIDTEHLHNQLKNQETIPVVVGWTGSHSTLKYLEPLVPVIAKLEQELAFEFLVICNKKPQWPLRSLRFLPWKKETEREDLLKMHFGLMPLPDDEWAKGKCGFKALQYMALGMPALVSPVGVNTEIVLHGEDGFVCTTTEDWELYIRMLIQNTRLRHRMGDKARYKIEQQFSVRSNEQNFLSLFIAS
jgi:glycosyltransferase involved in cell wall biosynthesis